MCSSVVEDRSFGLLVEVVGHHRAVALLQRKQSTIDRLAGQAEGEDLALALELGQGLVDLGVLQDIEVVAVRMHQHQLDAVGTQTLEAALHREARVGGRKVETRLAVLELLANLADDHPILALSGQQRAEPFLADAVGRRGVDQVDTEFAGQGQQLASLGVVWDGKTVGILHPLIAAQLHRAQPQWRNA